MSPVGWMYAQSGQLLQAEAGTYQPEIEAAAAEEGERPLFNDMQPDPEFGEPIPSPEGSQFPQAQTPDFDQPFPVSGSVKFDPDMPPQINADWPFEDPPPIGEPFDFMPPEPYEPPPFYPEIFTAPLSDFNFRTPEMDPCNFGMPDFGGGVCGPSMPGDSGWPGASGGGGGPSGGDPTGGLPGYDGGMPGYGGEIGGVGGVGGGAGDVPGGPDGFDPDFPDIGGDSKYTDTEVCFQNELATDIITQMAGELGLDASKVIINPNGTACTQRYTGCFPAGTNKFDILKQMAALCGYGVIDTGSGVIVQPPSPNPVHHYLDDYHNIFVLERDYTDADLYHHVEVFRPPLIRNGVEVYPYVAKVANVFSPFDAPITSVLRIRQTDYNLTDDQLQNIANMEAGKVSGLGAMCQVTTLWSQGQSYALYDQLHLRRFTRNWFTRWMIRSLEHTWSLEGHLTLAKCSYLGVDPTPALPPAVDLSMPLKEQLANYG